MLDFVSLDEVVPLVLLMALLGFVGCQASGKVESQWAARVGLIAFLAFAAAGWSEWQPESPAEFATLALRALMAAGLAAAASAVVLPVITYAVSSIAALFPKQPPKPEPVAQPKKELPEEPVIVEPVAPPLTGEEKAAAAKKKYEAKLAMLDAAGLDPTERHSAGEKAKQDYLRELDDAMR